MLGGSGACSTTDSGLTDSPSHPSRARAGCADAGTAAAAPAAVRRRSGSCPRDVRALPSAPTPALAAPARLVCARTRCRQALQEVLELCGKATRPVGGRQMQRYQRFERGEITYHEAVRTPERDDAIALRAAELRGDVALRRGWQAPRLGKAQPAEKRGQQFAQVRGRLPVGVNLQSSIRLRRRRRRFVRRMRKRAQCDGREPSLGLPGASVPMAGIVFRSG